MLKIRSLSRLMMSVGLVGLMSAPALAQNKTIDMKRQTFQPDYWEDTDHGEATLLAANVLSDAGADIAFSALNDTLAMSTGVSNPVAGYVLGKGLTAATDAIRDTDKQFARLAKFPGIDKTYLRYDAGDWCIIPDPGSLAHIEQDALEPMTRFDIPNDAGNQICRSPDGFYEDGAGTVWFFYSSTPQDKSWYGIGFGDSYCALLNPDDWLGVAMAVFPKDREPANLRQGTKFKINSAIDGVARGRTNQGVCVHNGKVASFDVKLTPDQQVPYRGILFNDHWISTGHGASLFYQAKGGNAIGDLLTSDMAGFLAGFSDASPMAFYGTGANLLSQFTAEDTTLPRMAKRPNDPSVYLQQDNSEWCYMADPEQLGIMKADEIEVHSTRSIPSNVRRGQTKNCSWPDGFYKVDNDNIDQVYYLYSVSESEPTWYGIGLGSRYCKVRTETQWRGLIAEAGGNARSPQDSLHRIDDLDFLTGRAEVANCPTRMVNGVMVDSEVAAFSTGTGYRSASSTVTWEHLANGYTNDVADQWVLGVGPVPGGYDIYTLRSGQWSKVPGGVVRIGGTAAEPWVVNDQGNIFRGRNGGWTNVSAGKLASDVGDGWMIAKNESHRQGGSKIYRFNKSTRQWDNIPGGAVRVGGTYDQTWVVQDDGDVYRYVNGTWEKVPGVNGQDVGHGWVTAKDKKIYRYNGSSNGWDVIPGAAISVGGTFDNPLVRTADQKVYHTK